MIYLLLLWFITWCLAKMPKVQPHLVIMLIIAIVLAVLIVLGVPQLEFHK